MSFLKYFLHTEYHVVNGKYCLFAHKAINTYDFDSRLNTSRKFNKYQIQIYKIQNLSISVYRVIRASWSCCRQSTLWQHQNWYRPTPYLFSIINQRRSEEAGRILNYNIISVLFNSRDKTTRNSVPIKKWIR